jgi:hypothetical protein
MQTWDYKVVEIYNQVKLGTVNWHWEEDGQVLPGKVDALGKCKELGAAGWELVSITVTGTPFRYNYWFKKPKI